MSPSIQAEYEDAMLTADVVVRRLERNVTKLRVTVGKIEAEAQAGNRKNMLAACRAATIQMQGLMVNLNTPDLTAWRQERAERDRARARNQEVLARKLLRAKQLLLELGWEEEALEADLKANAPDGRRLARRGAAIGRRRA